MAGNRRVFEAAMEEASSAAWDHQWQDAIAAYERALDEFPRDVGALQSLGMVYATIDEPEKALERYEQARELSPDSPGLYERIARIKRKLGRNGEAATACLEAAERYLKQDQATDKAAKCWQRAIAADPDRIKAHAQLLQYYQRQGDTKKAIERCRSLIRIYEKEGKTNYAIQVCEHALKLDPHDAQLLATLDRLRYGGSEAGEPEPAAEEALPPADPIEPDEMVDFDLTPAEGGAAEDRGSPAAITRQRALSDLAESFFEELEGEETQPQMEKAQVDALIGKAIDLQTRGEVSEAISAYEEVVEMGGERPAVNFNLGLLYQDKLRFDRAIEQFQKAVSHSDYRMGSHFALGECYRAKGRVDEAVEHFVEVLKIVDMGTVKREQADELIQLYEHLADGYVAKGDREQALEFTNSLVTFLSEQGWEDQVIRARQRLDALAEEGSTFSLAEMLVIPDSDKVLESIALAQEYTKRKLFYAALEESYTALDKAATYLPTHRQIAQTLLEMGRVDEAVGKLVSIGDTYLGRGNFRRAVAIYNRALKLSPMDTGVRTKLIDLLVSHGQIEPALEHYLTLAESYRNLAQMDQAREVYQDALRLAPRSAASRRWSVRILHKMGDIDMQRVDWRRAQEIYRRIHEIDPEDERANLTLIELHYRLGRSDLAVQTLDRLLSTYRENERTKRIFTVLKDLVDERPEDIALRTRLAQAHLNEGNIEQALEHLDRLGDLQLEAGRPEDAAATVRAIIRLNPPNVDAYRQLLEQIKSRSGGRGEG